MEAKEQLEVLKISNKNGMELTVINYGATVIRLQVPNCKNEIFDVVVCLDEAKSYLKSPYKETPLFLGSSIGRYAGRISGGQFSVDSKKYFIYNDNGVHLHGGKSGFSDKFWKVKDSSSNKVVLTYDSVHLEEGYPGNLAVEVTYFLTDDNSLKITYKASTDQATPVNLTNHSYFNLDGTGTILDHQLLINSDFYLDVDEQLIPSGKLNSSNETIFDLNNKLNINKVGFKGYDDTFVLNKERLKASLTSQKSGITMNVYTNQPAMVVYTPKNFPHLPFLKSFEDTAFPAICFETQNFPDAPNNNNFPNSILEPNREYLNETIFEFV